MAIAKRAQGLDEANEVDDEDQDEDEDWLDGRDGDDDGDRAREQGGAAEMTMKR